MEDKVKKIIQTFPNNKREDLIPILQSIQEEFDYLSEEAVYCVSQELEIPPSKVYSIATFYNNFRFKAIGKYHIKVCRGTACHLSKSFEILRELEKELKIKAGEVTPDKLFSLQTVPCMGACHLSPVIRINEEYYAQIEIEQIKNLLEEYKNKED